MYIKLWLANGVVWPFVRITKCTLPVHSPFISPSPPPSFLNFPFYTGTGQGGRVRDRIIVMLLLMILLVVILVSNEPVVPSNSTGPNPRDRETGPG